MRALDFEKAILSAFVITLCACANPHSLLADNKEAAKDVPPETQLQMADQSSTAAAATQSLWKYNGFLDAGYLLDFNHPANHLFRDRGTTFRVDALDLNMAGAGLQKDATQDSRWGMEFSVQGGKDSANFGFSATAPNVNGSDALRHFGAAIVSYLAPVGHGLTVQGGLFSSLIGYDSLRLRGLGAPRCGPKSQRTEMEGGPGRSKPSKL
jgi:hypothetical protein